MTADATDEAARAMLAVLKVFASDATLFPNAPAERRQELRPAMYFAMADYDRARTAIAAAEAAGIKAEG